ncbi:MAG TPA: AIR synthase-related protein [Spirochaetia bacterium]|nr:AIR synthase-related protein [Spirochaetia bacterium]
MKPPLAEGKLPPELLGRLLAYTSHAPELLVGAQPGEDAAVAAGAPTLVLTTDPITFTADRIGLYVVAVNANDIVAMGGRPIYLTTTLLLAPGATEDDVERVFVDIAAACRRAGMLWVGGHTEVTPVVTRTVVCGQAVGFLSGPPLSTGGARVGDLLCMSKWVGLEGTATIAQERPRETQEVLGAARYREVLGWVESPGICIVEEGKALEGMALSAGHDPTEGGIAMGIQEMCQRSGLGARVQASALPIREETRLLCERYGLDPTGLLSSGVFLFAAPPKVAQEACRILQARGIPACSIGEMLGPGEGVWLERDGARTPLRFSAQDEIVKLGRA